MPDITSANLKAEVTKAKNDVSAALLNFSTTAALAAVGNAINTSGKYKGKEVINETTGIKVYAVGPLAADKWKNVGSGADAHTPV